MPIICFRIVKVKRKTKTPTTDAAPKATTWDFSFTNAPTTIDFLSPDQQRIKDLEAEVKQLREKLVQAEKERDALKSAAKSAPVPSVATPAPTSVFTFAVADKSSDLETPKSTTVEVGTQKMFEAKESPIPAPATTIPQFNFNFNGSNGFSMDATTTQWPSFDTNAATNTETEKQEWDQNYNPEQEVPITPTVTEATQLLSNEPQKTGEEDEKTILDAKAKAYVMLKKTSEDQQTTTSEWKEVGVGKIKLNELKEPAGKARLIMRTQPTLKLILNTLVFEAMSVRKMQDKQLILGIIEEGLPKSYLVKVFFIFVYIYFFC